MKNDNNNNDNNNDEDNREDDDDDESDSETVGTEESVDDGVDVGMSVCAVVSVSSLSSCSVDREELGKFMNRATMTRDNDNDNDHDNTDRRSTTSHTQRRSCGRQKSFPLEAATNQYQIQRPQVLTVKAITGCHRSPPGGIHS